MAGCEFVCKNEDCKAKDTGFTITGPWPLGRIELVIENYQVKKMTDFRNQLLAQKKDGKRYVCIPYPNNTDIPIEGYRVQKWCNACKCVWSFDVMLSETAKDFESAKKEANISDSCSKCGGETDEFSKTQQEGLDCPCCNTKLKQYRWFSKI